MNSYSFFTRRPSVPVLPVLLVIVIATLVFGISRSSAQTSELATPRFDPTVELEIKLALAEAKIDALEEQLAISRQASLRSEHRIETQRATILGMQGARQRSATSLTTDSGFESWKAGYAIGGGRNLAAFENIILPCESGGEPNPDAAVGPTDDWGRAQINRPTWGARFEELTGASFEEHITDPALNGYMAAVVEQEHGRGLNAWTCWRRR